MSEYLHTTVSSWIRVALPGVVAWSRTECFTSTLSSQFTIHKDKCLQSSCSNVGQTTVDSAAVQPNNCPVMQALIMPPLEGMSWILVDVFILKKYIYKKIQFSVCKCVSYSALLPMGCPTLDSELCSQGLNVARAINCRPGVYHAGQSINVCAVPRMDVKLGVLSAGISWWTLSIPRCWLFLWKVFKWWPVPRTNSKFLLTSAPPTEAHPVCEKTWPETSSLLTPTQDAVIHCHHEVVLIPRWRYLLS